MRAAGQREQGDAVFDAAIADLRAGRDAQQTLRSQVRFEDVPAPRTIAPYAAAIAATVRAAGPGDQPDVAWGRLILLYDPAGQPGWAGRFRVIAYIRADVEPEIAADPLLGSVSWSWLTEALDAHAAGYAAPSGTVTRVITEGFGGKSDEPASTEIELRASWSPVGPPPVSSSPVSPPPVSSPPVTSPPVPTAASTVPELAGHVAGWCDALCAAAGLPPAGADVTVMPTRGRYR
jgi:hypothetical protein